MILVTGATGNIGSELVRLLVEAGEKVRVLVRDPAKAAKLGGRIEVARGDLDQPETLAPALAGADKLFLLAPGFNVPAQEASAIDAAKKAGVKHVVMISSLGVHQKVGSGPLHIPGEQKLQSSGLGWTLVRPNEFMSNAFMWRDTIRTQGAIYLPTGAGRHACIHPHDIAAVAFKALTTPGHEGRIYELTGPEALSTADMAATIGAVTGKQVQHVDIPAAAFREQLLKFGMPTSLADPFAGFYARVKENALAEVLPTVEQVVGRKPRSFQQWARENAAAFT